MQVAGGCRRFGACRLLEGVSLMLEYSEWGCNGGDMHLFRLMSENAAGAVMYISEGYISKDYPSTWYIMTER